MKSSKRLNHKVKKQLKTKKRRQVGRGVEKYTISLGKFHIENKNTAYYKPTNYTITIDGNTITGPEEIITPEYAKVIANLDTYINSIKKVGVDSVTLFIGRNAHGETIFKKHTNEKTSDIKPDANNTIDMGDMDDLLINRIIPTHTRVNNDTDPYMPEFYGDEGKSSIKRRTAIKGRSTQSKKVEKNNRNAPLPEIKNPEVRVGNDVNIFGTSTIKNKPPPPAPYKPKK